MTAISGNRGHHFGGYIKQLFNDRAIITVDYSPVMKKGEEIVVPKADFARQSFVMGVGEGDYVEGLVFVDEKNPQKPREFKFVTKII